MPVKSKSGRIFDLPSPEEEAKIRAGVADDPDASELPDDALQQLRSVGRPKAAVSIRLSPEVIEYFKVTGKGW